MPPAPVPADADLRDFPFTPVFRARLFGSSFHARANDSEWRAGFTLWLKSWDQVPAGSLPDDDVDLCRLAELGRDQKTWKRLKAMALHGWVKCSDGLLYHEVVAEAVLEALKKRKTAQGRGLAGALKRWGKGDAPTINNDAPTNADDGPSTKTDSTDDASTTEKHSKGSGSEVEVEVEGNLKPGSVGVTPEIARDPPPPTSRFEKQEGQSPPGPAAQPVAGFKTVTESWASTPESIAATGKTLAVKRRANQSDAEYADCVRTAVNDNMRNAEADAERREQRSRERQLAEVERRTRAT